MIVCRRNPKERQPFVVRCSLEFILAINASHLKQNSTRAVKECSERASGARRIVCLSNVFDGQYAQLRGESIALPLSSTKRRDLFHCLERATEREVIILSSPPKAAERRRGRWLPPTVTRFSSHRQFVCANWDGPKIRIPSSWVFYAAQVIDRTISGDIVLIDNYEFLYIIAAYAARLRRKLIFVLEYEDGKHAIDRGWDRILSASAESLGRPLLSGALLSQPSLATRLPADLPREMVPGFFRRTAQSLPQRSPRSALRFLYSGTLDEARGVNLILNALPLLPAAGWELNVTGSGPLERQVLAASKDPRWNGRLHFHGVVLDDQYRELIATCDIALNCQLTSNPISAVTYPSKTFTYLSAGLGLISSTASRVPEVLGGACWYYEGDTPDALARVMVERLRDTTTSPSVDALRQVEERYSIEGTISRLQTFFERVFSACG